MSSQYSSFNNLTVDVDAFVDCNDDLVSFISIQNDNYLILSHLRLIAQ